MPRRFSFTDLASRGTAWVTPNASAELAMQNPSRHIMLHSQGSLQPVKDFVPHQAKGHEWQRDAFAYNQLVAEVGALHALMAEQVASCNLQVVRDEIDAETGQVSTSVAQDARTARVMRAFIGPLGGQKELKRKAALHYQIAGESILIGTPLRDQIGNDRGWQWEFLSPLEIKTERKRVGGEDVTIMTRMSGLEGDGPIVIDAYSARWWRSDAEYSGRSDSPMRRVLPLCRELVILSEVVDAIAKQRLNAGILLLPTEGDFGPDDENSQEGNENGDVDKFRRDLAEHLSAPVEDRKSAASLVPLLLEAPAELIESIKMLWVAQDLEETYQGLREELLERIARGLDAPPEMIKGKAALNHWSAYSVDNDFVNRHVVPLGEALCEFLTIAYLRRMLMLYEGMTDDEAAMYRLVFDARPLASRDNENEVSESGWDRFLLSDKAWLKANGFVEGDMPEEEERKRRMIEKMVLSAPGIYGMALLPVLYPDLEDRMLEVQRASEAERRAREAGPAASPDVEDPHIGPRDGEGDGAPANGLPDAGPPTDSPDGVAPVQRAVDDALIERLVTAADAALARALERASSRLLTRSKKDAELQERYSSLPKESVLANTTSFDFRTLGVEPEELVADAWVQYFSDASGWIEDWALEMDAPPHLAREIARKSARRICRELDDLIRRGFGAEIPRSSNGLRVPRSLAQGAVSSAIRDITARK